VLKQRSPQRTQTRPAIKKSDLQVISTRDMVNWIQKITASPFIYTEDYPEALGELRNRFEILRVAKNEENIYRIGYRVNNEKERVYFADGDQMIKGYAVFNYRKKLGRYEEIPENPNDPEISATYKVFTDVGDKELNAALIKLERNRA